VLMRDAREEDESVDEVVGLVCLISAFFSGILG